MKISDITQYLESLAPLSTQESYDNSGLITGNFKTELTNALISLDCTEAVVEEAIQKKCNLIIAHHPIVFKGLKKLTGSNYVERTVIKAIKNDIAIYAIHTNLDNFKNGVNKKIGQKLGITKRDILQPMSQKLLKLVVFVPDAHRENVMKAMFDAGAGHIGNYSDCSFSLSGIGTFKANEGANPFVGGISKRHQENENRVEVVLEDYKLKNVVNHLLAAHPYEEVAYDLYPLVNSHKWLGAGMIGELENEMGEMEFLKKIKQQFNVSVVRHTELLNKKVKKVAWCGGSGSFLLKDAIQQGADFFVTGDFKYHEFFDAENKIVIADVGHFESEQYTIELISELLQEKFPKFAPSIVETNTNPVKYF